MQKGLLLLFLTLTAPVSTTLYPPAHPSSPGQQASGTPELKTPARQPSAFEVATVKPAAPSTDGHTHINYPPGGSFSAANITLAALMQWAFDCPERQMLGGPDWLGSIRFDIQAKTDTQTDFDLRSLNPREASDTKRKMVQALLIERFHLQLHHEIRTLEAYDLIVARGGPKLEPGASNGNSIGRGRTYLKGQSLTAASLAQQLSYLTGKIVVDKTGLPGRYAVWLQWSPDDATSADNSAPSLYTAIQEQLGLKLVRGKEPLPVLVIDQIEQPSPN